MNKSLFTSMFLALSLLLLAPASRAGAQSICGELNVLAFNGTQARSFLDQYGLASTLGKKSLSCGIPGEDFNICRACRDEVSGTQEDILRPMVTDPKHRAWHYMWHVVEVAALRRFPNTRDLEVQRLQDLGVLPSQYSSEEVYRNSLEHWGESFFYMHRQMLKMMQFELTFNGQPCIAPWKRPPTSPVSKNWTHPALKTGSGVDQSVAVRIQKQLVELDQKIQKLEDPNYLREVTLDQLGRKVIDTIHFSLHNAWADHQQARKNCAESNELYSKSCDDLTSNLSSAVNKHFWKIHGYIDSLVWKWMQNQPKPYTQIALNCQARGNCYTWRGTYMGKSPLEMTHQDLEIAEKILSSRPSLGSEDI